MREGRSDALKFGLGFGVIAKVRLECRVWWDAKVGKDAKVGRTRSESGEQSPHSKELRELERAGLLR